MILTVFAYVFAVTVTVAGLFMAGMIVVAEVRDWWSTRDAALRRHAAYRVVTAEERRR